MKFSLTKGPFCDPSIRSLVDSHDSSKTLFITSRSSTILPSFVGLKFAVHNGKEFKTFGVITPSHVGHKFGEFSATKRPAHYKKKYN